MSDDGVGCAKPTGRLVGQAEEGAALKEQDNDKEEPMPTAKVGAQAPDFEAPAYHKGSFTTVKLSDYFGQWIMLCFYPGDFTFV